MDHDVAAEIAGLGAARRAHARAVEPVGIADRDRNMRHRVRVERAQRIETLRHAAVARTPFRARMGRARRGRPGGHVETAHVGERAVLRFGSEQIDAGLRLEGGEAHPGGRIGHVGAVEVAAQPGARRRAEPREALGDGEGRRGGRGDPLRPRRQRRAGEGRGRIGGRGGVAVALARPVRQGERAGDRAGEQHRE